MEVMTDHQTLDGLHLSIQNPQQQQCYKTMKYNGNKYR